MLAVVTLFGVAFGGDKYLHLSVPEARLEQLVEANIVAVHAYQILLARKQSNTDHACWPPTDPKDADLEALVAHQTSLLEFARSGKTWALGAPSTFNPAKDLQPLPAAPSYPCRRIFQ